MIEILGIVASLFIILAFLFKDVRIIRILDTVGALLYVIYGILINSWSNIFLNTVLILIQIYRLIELKRNKIIWKNHYTNQLLK